MVVSCITNFYIIPLLNINIQIYNENVLTCSQKVQLIFFTDDSLSHNNNDIDIKNIDIALSILNKMKLEIQLQHEKLKSKKSK